MITISVKHNFPEVQRALREMGKQARFAAAKALTHTAQQLKKDVLDDMRRQFDRPTPFVLKSLFVSPATKQNLSAAVFLKDRSAGSDPATHYLGHQFAGGGRSLKAAERLLLSRGFLAQGEFLVPGGGARLDAYGNMSRGQIVQILSQIGIKRAGFDSTPTKSKRSRRNVKRAGRIFWSFGPGSIGPGAFKGKIKFDELGYFGRKQHLPKGAWVDTGPTLKPLWLAVRTPRYRQRIDLKRLADATIAKHFQRNFDQAFADALRTAR